MCTLKYPINEFNKNVFIQIFEYIYYTHFLTNFIVLFTKYNDFLWGYWFLAKKISDFVSLIQKLYNLYCHSSYPPIYSNLPNHYPVKSWWWLVIWLFFRIWKKNIVWDYATFDCFLFLYDLMYQYVHGYFSNSFFETTFSILFPRLKRKTNKRFLLKIRK